MGYSGGNDYYQTQAWADAVAANDALQAAVAQAAAAADAVDHGTGTAAAANVAAAAVTNALKNYTEATSAGNDVLNSAESHVDKNLTPGPQVYSEPETVFTPGGFSPGPAVIVDVTYRTPTPIDPGIGGAGETTPATPTWFKPALVIAGVILLAKWLS